VNQLFMVHPGPLPTDRPEPRQGRLRHAVGTDADDLAVLLTDAFEEHWDGTRVRSELLAAPDVAVTWVVEDPVRGLVATASERLVPDLYPDAGYLHWVATAPAARGAGLGSLVTVACLAGFAGRGLPRAVLETEDFRVPAVRTYLRLGFVPEYRTDDERLRWSALFPRLFQR
jgi:mycothiol synthase